MPGRLACVAVPGVVMAPCEPFPAAPRRILLVGLGGGALPVYLHRHYPQAAIDVVEIVPEVVLAAERFFGFCQDAHSPGGSRRNSATRLTWANWSSAAIFRSAGETMCRCCVMPARGSEAGNGSTLRLTVTNGQTGKRPRLAACRTQVDLDQPGGGKTEHHDSSPITHVTQEICHVPHSRRLSHQGGKL